MLNPVTKTAVKSIEKESRSTEQMLEAKPLRKIKEETTMSLKQNVARPIITSWCRAILLYYSFLLPSSLYTSKEKKLQNKSPIPLRLVIYLLASAILAVISSHPIRCMTTSS